VNVVVSIFITHTDGCFSNAEIHASGAVGQEVLQAVTEEFDRFCRGRKVLVRRDVWADLERDFERQISVFKGGCRFAFQATPDGSTVISRPKKSEGEIRLFGLGPKS
jgi:hypothetical protein